MMCSHLSITARDWLSLFDEVIFLPLVTKTVLFCFFFTCTEQLLYHFCLPKESSFMKGTAFLRLYIHTQTHTNELSVTRTETRQQPEYVEHKDMLMRHYRGGTMRKNIPDAPGRCLTSFSRHFISVREAYKNDLTVFYLRPL